MTESADFLSHNQHSTYRAYYNNDHKVAHDTKFDSDSYLIGIDNHASASMTNSESDFIEEPILVDLKIKGIKGHLTTSKVGTVRWMIQDDSGRNHRFDIPGTYLVPELPIRLLSPQHVAKEMMKKTTIPDNMQCITFADRVTLSWHHGKYSRTIPLSQSNVPILRSGPGFKNYTVQCTPDKWSCQALKAYSANYENLVDAQDELPEVTPSPISDELEDEPTTLVTAEEKLMVWHITLAHMPFKILQEMAKVGHLPKSLAHCIPPKCQACLYGKATKVPWRVKGEHKQI
jgi:GAG-pre-integrase domain